MLLHHEPPRRASVELLSGRARRKLVDVELAGVEVCETTTWWHGDPPATRSAFFEPFGAGLAVERAVLDDTLRQSAVAAGATLLIRRALKLERCAGAWQVDGISARHLVLATGGRRPGPPRAALVVAKQVTAFARLAAADDVLRVERVEGGWLYSMPDPAGGTFVGYCGAKPRELEAALRTSRLGRALRGRTLRDRGRGSALVRAFERVEGPGWLAAGNAAFQPDPLCGEGLWFALETARDAAAVVLGTLPADAYARRIARLVEAHVVERARLLAG
jgi:flavin-dependent dehydrogenase